VKKLLVLFAALLLVAGFALSQGTASGNFIGNVADEEGNGLPGVTVTLWGGVIGEMTDVTSAQGNYRFVGIPIGRGYNIKFELSGFKTLIQEGYSLLIGQTVTIDATLVMATLEEEVTVYSQSELINPKTTTVAKNITSEEIAKLPTSRNPWSVMALAPGMLIDREDIGGNESGQQSAYYGHGVADGDSTWRVDGANITDPSAIGAAPAYLNMNAYEELQISYGSNDITAQTGGVQLNFVTRRAGNQFSGAFHLYVEDEQYELDNIDKADQANLQPGYESPGIYRLYMYGADFGGPLWQDHLWFYGSWTVQDIDARTIVQTSDATWLMSAYLKFNWQFGDNMGTIFYSYDVKEKAGRTVWGAASQSPGTLFDQEGPGSLYSGNIQHVFGDLLVNVKAIYTDGGFSLDPRGTDIDANGINSGPPGVYWNTSWAPFYYVSGSLYHYITDRNQIDVALDANLFLEDVLGGDHEWRFGVDFVNADTTSQTLYPNQMMTYEYTDFGYSRDVMEPNTNGVFDVNFKRYSAYISDTFTTGDLTVMLGVRYDQEQGAHNAAESPAFSLVGFDYNPWPQYLGAKSVPAGEVDQKWQVISPRLSLTYDLNGDGVNVFKLPVARYGSQSGNSISGFVWPLGVRYIANWWADDGDGIVEPGEFVISTPGVDAVWYGGFDRTDPYKNVSSNTFDSDYNSPLVDELTFTYERSLTEDMAVSLSLFYKRRFNTNRDIGIMADGSLETADNWFLAGDDPNLGQPYYERYSVPVAEQRTNYKERYSRYLAASLVFKKRFSQNWMLDASFTLSDWKQFRDKSEQFDQTNFDYFDGGVVAPESGGSGLSDIYVNARWEAKISGLYQLPYEINLSAIFMAREGYVIPYFANFSRGSGLGTTSMYEGGKKFGDDRLPTFWILNLGIEKVFHPWERASVAIFADAFNVTNNATTMKQEANLMGSTDTIMRILNPTVFQFGVRFEF
jgi:hypothetical protein